MQERDYYADPLRYEAEVSFLAADVAWYRDRARQQGGAVLVLGCGTGRLLFPLLAAGLEVTGLDLRPAMLDRARARALTLPRQLTRRLELAQGDMRDFHLPGRFGSVLIPLNGLMHLHRDEEVSACFACVRRHLRPGGRLLFDVTRPVPELLRDFGGPEGIAIRTLHVAGQRYLQRESHHFDPVTQISETVFTYEPLGPGGQPYRCRLRLRMFTPQHLEKLLTDAGFECCEHLDGFGLQVDTAESATQILVARPGRQ